MRNEITKKLFNFFDKNSKTQITWVKEVKAALGVIKITYEETEGSRISKFAKEER